MPARNSRLCAATQVVNTALGRPETLSSNRPDPRPGRGQVDDDDDEPLDPGDTGAGVASAVVVDTQPPHLIKMGGVVDQQLPFGFQHGVGDGVPRRPSDA